MTRPAAAVCFELVQATLNARVWRGDPPETWFDKPPHAPPKQLRFRRPRKGMWMTPYGRKTMPEIAEILGMPYHTLSTRMYQKGMPQEEAFNRKRSHGGRSKKRPEYFMPPSEYRRRVREQFELEKAARK